MISMQNVHATDVENQSREKVVFELNANCPVENELQNSWDALNVSNTILQWWRCIWEAMKPESIAKLRHEYMSAKATEKANIIETPTFVRLTTQIALQISEISGKKVDIKDRVKILSALVNSFEYLSKSVENRSKIEHPNYEQSLSSNEYANALSAFDSGRVFLGIIGPKMNARKLMACFKRLIDFLKIVEPIFVNYMYSKVIPSRSKEEEGVEVVCDLESDECVDM